MRQVSISHEHDGTVTLTTRINNRRFRISMTQEEAIRLSHRLQSYAKSQHDLPEIVVIKDDQ